MIVHSKDVWKLLFKSINFDDEDVLFKNFVYIEDILCKKPSLLSFGYRQIYQDKFVLLLANKLLECVGKTPRIDQGTLDLQKKILRSTLIYRPPLFVLLTKFYACVLQNIKKYAIFTMNKPNFVADIFEINLENCDDASTKNHTLRQLYSPTICFKLTDVNGLIKGVAEIVTLANSIGFGIYPVLFREIFRTTFGVLRDLEPKIKLTCLQYYNIFLKELLLNDTFEERFLIDILQCLFRTWKQVLWSQCQNIISEGTAALGFTTIDIIEKILCTEDSFCGENTVNSQMICRHVFSTLFVILQSTKKRKLKSSESMLKAYVDLVAFLQKMFENPHSNREQKMLLQQFAFQYPSLLRLLFGTSTCNKNEKKYFLQNLSFLQWSFFYCLRKQEKLHTDYEYILENVLCLERLQNRSFIQKNKLMKISAIFESKTSACNWLLLKWFVQNVSNSNSKQSDYLKCLQIRICSSILQIEIFKKKFEEYEIHSIVIFIEKPIRDNVNILLENNETPHLSFEPLLTSISMLESLEINISNILNTCADLLRIISNEKYKFVSQQKMLLCKKIICLLHKKKRVAEDITTTILKNEEFNKALSRQYLQTQNDFTKLIGRNTKRRFKYEMLHESFLTITSRELRELILKTLLKDECIGALSSNLKLLVLLDDELLRALSSSLNAIHLNQSMLTMMLSKINKNLLRPILHMLLKAAFVSLDQQTLQIYLQRNILKVIFGFSNAAILNTDWVLYFFKLILVFLVHPNSFVIYEASLIAVEMCQNHQTQPMQLWNWNKKCIFKPISKIASLLYLRKGVSLPTSLKHFVKVLGFTCVYEFTFKHYRLLMAFFMPQCIKESHCKGVYMGICKITRKSLSNLFISSFLRIYTYVFLTEGNLIKKFMDIITKCTSTSLNQLLNVNIKQTVSDVLIHFHHNTAFVRHIITSLLTTETNQISIKNFISFIADRFLGVLTYIKVCFADENIEKALKEEAACSLGKIIKVIGTEYVTKFRFKIIAMLEFITSINDRSLNIISVKIWDVFIHTVNIHELGPSIGQVAASLQRLLPVYTNEVNNIYAYLILINNALIYNHLQDLYFLSDNQDILPSIRECLRPNEQIRENETGIIANIKFLSSQISSPNINLRIHGLTYLKNLIKSKRQIINHFITNEIYVDPVFSKIINNLVSNCFHDDLQLQMSSAKCMGELGAIDPNYLPFQNIFERNNQIALSVRTDDFAIIALKELCRVYQFQKGKKYVDCYGLAIQETLSVIGISPSRNNKLSVWNAMPSRIRQIMIPFLSSCYTTSSAKCQCEAHPIFTSNACRSFPEWAFVWATRLIALVQVEETKHLLNSYTPSMKRDINILTFFFPYILLHALIDSKETEIQFIYEEMEALISFCLAKSALESTYDSSVLKKFYASRFVANKLSIKLNGKTFCGEFPAKSSGNITARCVKFCFSLLDFLYHWLNEWSRMHGEPSICYKSSNDGLNRVHEFLKKFDKNIVAKANFIVGEFERALIFLEDFVAENQSSNFQDQLPFFIDIYTKLCDIDSLEGAVHKKQNNLNLTEEILINKIKDRPHQIINCYDQLMSSHACQTNYEHLKGMIDCYLNMEATETALLIAEGVWQNFSVKCINKFFQECKMEIFWRLGRYDDLKDLTEQFVDQPTTNWRMQCAKSFILFRLQLDCNETVKKIINNKLTIVDWIEKLDRIRFDVLSTMRDCSSSKHISYRHCYPNAIKLHLIEEVENAKLLSLKICQHLIGSNSRKEYEKFLLEIKSFFYEWKLRLEILQPITRTMGPILNFRRNLLLEIKELLSRERFELEFSFNSFIDILHTEIGKLWIRSISMYRDEGNLVQAHMSLLKAQNYRPKSLFLEKAQLLWEMGEQTTSLKLIEENIKRIESKCNENIQRLNVDDQSLYTETKYLLAVYSAESMSVCAELNLRYFKDVISLNKTSERYYIYLAYYMEKILNSYSENQKDSNSGRKIVLEVMVSYAKSLRCGTENVYQSLPRLLTLWFDLTAEFELKLNSQAHETDNQPDDHHSFTPKELLRKMNDLINNCINVFPASVFYTAYSQLLSRICHPSIKVFKALREIIVRLLVQYSHQSMWKLLPVNKSFNNFKTKRCKLILTDSRLDDSSYQKLLADFNLFTENLIELTNKEVISEQSNKVSALAKQLPKLFEDPNFSKILLPFEKFMHISFPISRNSTKSLSQNQIDKYEFNTHIPSNPFPHKHIYISNICEELIVLPSAAKPKKILFQCDDSHHYTVMVKPKDDLRRDFRLMEFNGLVKRFLYIDSQARHRHLRIRTYSVVPFNEECGLVEWLPKLNSYRGICKSLYAKRGFGMTDRNLRRYLLPRNDTIENKRRVFLEILLPNHPPVFHEWFRQRFPNPRIWYEARGSYIKTLAVMSIVGYILGLGDRHGENILLDEVNGDVVHVDFNCLFNQGELFAYPELVPFRLTHNMTFAMGPLKYDGPFKKSCEITLQVLKLESATLMSVLRPFVYDLAGYNRNQAKVKSCGEFTDPKAMVDVQRIDDRLQGYVKKTSSGSMPLSPEGHISVLIAEATNVDNLSAMYIGWGGYL